MKAALSTLTPATTRARRSAPAQACTAAKVGTTNKPPAMARMARSIADVNAARGGEEASDAERSRAVDEIMAGPAEIDREHTEQHGADQCRQNDDAPGRKPGGETGAERDRDGEDRQEYV